MNLVILIIRGSEGWIVTIGFYEIWVEVWVDVVWTLVELYVLTSVTTLVYLSMLRTIVMGLGDAESATMVDW